MPGNFHYQRNVLEASCWCNPCGKNPMHRIDNGRRGPCLECMAPALEAKLFPEDKPAEQQRLFEDHRNLK